MKKTAAAATIFLILAGTGCIDFLQGGVKGSGVETTETREVDRFTGIDLTEAFFTDSSGNEITEWT